MNQMPIAKRAQILGFLVEGMSLRAASRLADCSINTVTKLLVDVGTACADFQDQALRNLPSKRIQCDEIWSFVGAKQKNVAKGAAGYGDVWTWTAICADTKLVASWMVGSRDGDAAQTFIGDLAPRLRNRVQLTTDGHKVYVEAVESAFGAAVDYAMLVKVYGEGPKSDQRRYSPSEFVCATKQTVTGNPDMDKVSTSYVERQNLTMRMSCRRFTRLTNAFSKKVENHAHAVALHFMHYNFGRIHKSLRVTPAMEAGVSNHVWSLEEIAALVPAPESKPRGPYKKKLQIADGG
ncbi:IS1 family transposase [Ahniella affigens]|uniref:IS1 family transposase n=1 Tax=Ahniella affigens TaxID=2021234 RepID=A0A2P1PMZ4_9GAMM|nr:IS1 family transposase [Ahniella affigens]AVP96220.1 IS1 family transposase [Ahniella affigens]